MALLFMLRNAKDDKIFFSAKFQFSVIQFVKVISHKPFFLLKALNPGLKLLEYILCVAHLWPRGFRTKNIHRVCSAFVVSRLIACNVALFSLLFISVSYRVSYFNKGVFKFRSVTSTGVFKKGVAENVLLSFESYTSSFEVYIPLYLFCVTARRHQKNFDLKKGRISHRTPGVNRRIWEEMLAGIQKPIIGYFTANWIKDRERKIKTTVPFFFFSSKRGLSK